MRSISKYKFDGSKHPRAVRWDDLHGRSTDSKYWGMSDTGLLVPLNRPCEWCGKIVSLGYIHSVCMDEETATLYYEEKV